MINIFLPFSIHRNTTWWTSNTRVSSGERRICHQGDRWMSRLQQHAAIATTYRRPDWRRRCHWHRSRPCRRVEFLVRVEERPSTTSSRSCHISGSLHRDSKANHMKDIMILTNTTTITTTEDYYYTEKDAKENISSDASDYIRFRNRNTQWGTLIIRTLQYFWEAKRETARRKQRWLRICVLTFTLYPRRVVFIVINVWVNFATLYTAQIISWIISVFVSKSEISGQNTFPLNFLKIETIITTKQQQTHLQAHT